MDPMGNIYLLYNSIKIAVVQVHGPDMESKYKVTERPLRAWRTAFRPAAESKTDQICHLHLQEANLQHDLAG